MGVLIASAAIGVAVGVLSGMLGVGGGMVMIPVFRLGYGMAAIQATATSLFAIVPISIAGMVTHVRNRTCYPRLGVAAGLGGALTSPAGVYLASMSPSWAIMLAAAAVIAYSSVTMLRKALALPKGAGLAAPADEGATDSEEAVSGVDPQLGRPCAKRAGDVQEVRLAGAAPNPDGASEAVSGDSGERPLALGTRTLAVGAVIGMVAGLASGYVGVGGGFIMVPLFMALLGTTMRKTSGTSLFAICILAVPGVAGQLALGNVLVAQGAAMAAGAIPGAVLGASLVRRIPERLLRFIFAGMLAFAAIMLVVKEVLA